jgi:hypothetical protein
MIDKEKTIISEFKVYDSKISQYVLWNPILNQKIIIFKNI